eukprot:358864-Chlamydomonas_euryale.AAC.8
MTPHTPATCILCACSNCAAAAPAPPLKTKSTLWGKTPCRTGGWVASAPLFCFPSTATYRVTNFSAQEDTNHAGTGVAHAPQLCPRAPHENHAGTGAAAVPTRTPRKPCRNRRRSCAHAHPTKTKSTRQLRQPRRAGGCPQKKSHQSYPRFQSAKSPCGKSPYAETGVAHAPHLRPCAPHNSRPTPQHTNGMGRGSRGGRRGGANRVQVAHVPQRQPCGLHNKRPPQNALNTPKSSEEEQRKGGRGVEGRSGGVTSPCRGRACAAAAPMRTCHSATARRGSAAPQRAPPGNLTAQSSCGRGGSGGGWLIGYPDDWLVDWLACWLIGWSAGWLAGWLVAWLAGLSVGWHMVELSRRKHKAVFAPPHQYSASRNTLIPTFPRCQQPPVPPFHRPHLLRHTSIQLFIPFTLLQRQQRPCPPVHRVNLLRPYQHPALFSCCFNHHNSSAPSSAPPHLLRPVPQASTAQKSRQRSGLTRRARHSAPASRSSLSTRWLCSAGAGTACADSKTRTHFCECVQRAGRGEGRVGD